eukprot:208292_1
MERRSNSSGSVPTKILLITLTAVAINADGCIRSHPNYTIDYISNNLNNDPSIRYLGTKPSATDCQNSCQNLNYLCDKSSSDASRSSHFDPWFDNANCEITIPNGDVYVSLTDDLVAKEYIIEAQFTITDEWEAGIYFKSNYYNVTELFTDASSLSYEYFFGITPVPDTGHGFTGYWHVENAGESGHHILSNASTPTNITYNTMYTLQVHVHDNDFVTYIEGDVHFSTYLHPSEAINASSWAHQNYAGVYTWDASAVMHSFKVIFPDASDNPDELLCAAYIYDTVYGDCHGYYGNNYTQIETSLSSHTLYDCAILYPSVTCDPTAHPTTSIPTVNPTNIPTKTPTKTPTTTLYPTHDPTVEPTTDEPTTKIPTASPLRVPTINAYVVTSDPTFSEAEVDGSHSTTTSATGVGGTQAPKPNPADTGAQIMTEVAIILASLFIICLCVGIVFVYHKYYAKNTPETYASEFNAIEVIEKDKEDGVLPPGGVMVCEEDRDRDGTMVSTDSLYDNMERANDSHGSDLIHRQKSDNEDLYDKMETANDTHGSEIINRQRSAENEDLYDNVDTHDSPTKPTKETNTAKDDNTFGQ